MIATQIAYKWELATRKDGATIEVASGDGEDEFVRGNSPGCQGVPDRLWMVCGWFSLPRVWATNKLAPNQPDRRFRHHYLR